MATGRGADDADDETDEEQVESEWHTWLAVIILVGGIALVLAPNWLVPGLIRGIGPVLVIVAVVGWLITWGYRKWS